MKFDYGRDISALKCHSRREKYSGEVYTVGMK